MSILQIDFCDFMYIYIYMCRYGGLNSNLNMFGALYMTVCTWLCVYMTVYVKNCRYQNTSAYVMHLGFHVSTWICGSYDSHIMQNLFFVYMFQKCNYIRVCVEAYVCFSLKTWYNKTMSTMWAFIHTICVKNLIMLSRDPGFLGPHRRQTVLPTWIMNRCSTNGRWAPGTIIRNRNSKWFRLKT